MLKRLLKELHHLRKRFVVFLAGLPFFLKIILIILIIFAATALLMTFQIKNHARSIYLEFVKEELRSLAAIVACKIDGDLLERLQKPEDEASCSYRQLQRVLQDSKQANLRIQDLYLVRKSTHPSRLSLVVNTYAVGRNHVHIGQTYDLSRAPEMKKGFRGAAVEREFIMTRWGLTLSGYAPVKNRRGEVVGILGVDFLAKLIQKRFNDYSRELIFQGLLALAVMLLISLLLTKKLVIRLYNIKRTIDGLLEEKPNDGAKEFEHDEIKLLDSNINKLIRKITGDKEQMFIHFTMSMVKALEARDPYTHDHSEQVAEITNDIMREIHLDRDQQYTINFAAVLHDIGKIGIPDQLLNKPSKLTDEEFAIIRQHSVIGEKILEAIPELAEIRKIVRHHHERLDGRGYPDGLSGMEIHFGARIITVADSFQAMISDRSYRKGMSQELALQELVKHSGTQFDPLIVEVLLRICQLKTYKD